jgi:broad specificity phosphatase PhoE
VSDATSLIDLLRHGETEADPGFRGSTDDRLTVHGMEQMWTATSGKRGWQCIVTSPLRRCADFASALAERLHTPLEIDDRLREIHFGEWEAQTAEAITRSDPGALQRFWADPIRHPPPGAESLPVFEARVLSCWREQLRAHAGKRVLLVTHGGPIRAILGYVYRVPWKDLLRLDLPHASVTHVRVEQTRNGSARAGVVASIDGPC